MVQAHAERKPAAGDWASHWNTHHCSTMSGPSLTTAMQHKFSSNDSHSIANLERGINYLFYIYISHLRYIAYDLSNACNNHTMFKLKQKNKQTKKLNNLQSILFPTHMWHWMTAVPFLEVINTSLEMYLSSGDDDMLSCLLHQHLHTRVSLVQQPQSFH